MASTAVITLPEGITTLDQLLFLQGQEVAIAIVHSVVFAVICWDYLVLLPDEILLYRSWSNENLWKRPSTYLFIVLRYSAILAMLPAIFFTAAQSQHCPAAAALSQVGAVFVVGASGGIFCLRIFALWQDNKRIQGVVILCYLLMISCWISAATTHHAVTGPSTPFASNCAFEPVPSWSTISFASSVLFDSVVLALTIVKLRPNKVLQNSRIGRQVFRDTLLYFSITTVTNVITLVIESLNDRPTLIKPATIPFSTLMTVTMGSRVYLNLRLLDQRDKDLLSKEKVTFESDASGTCKWRVMTSEKSEIGSNNFLETQLSTYLPTESLMDLKPCYANPCRDNADFDPYRQDV